MTSAINDAAKHDAGVLKRLAKHALDSADGYAEAAKITKDPDLKREFEAMAEERAALVQGLKAQLRALGADDDVSGSVAAAAHRVFLDMRAAVQNDTKSAVMEVERGEDFMRDTVRDALRDVSPATRSALEPLAEGVQAAHDRWSALKHRLTGAGDGPGGKKIT